MPEVQITISEAELVREEPVGDGTWSIRTYRVALPPEVTEQVQAAMPGIAGRKGKS